MKLRHGESYVVRLLVHRPAWAYGTGDVRRLLEDTGFAVHGVSARSPYNEPEPPTDPFPDWWAWARVTWTGPDADLRDELGELALVDATREPAPEKPQRRWALLAGGASLVALCTLLVLRSRW
jgi:hypothetical protein